MNVLRFQDDNNLTEAEMLMLLKVDDPEYDMIVEECEASDIEDRDQYQTKKLLIEESTSLELFLRSSTLSIVEFEVMGGDFDLA
ncbi:hypothetical protein FQA39_LY12284 [Lamprigera yunnana]|nr:hypothetical protein FQA39_LY12284 [Lamprigera yunnana]